MRFWDSSAVVPLLVAEKTTVALTAMLRTDVAVLVWWGTPVECISAIARREREGAIAPDQAARAFQRLRTVSDLWQEVLPSEPVRSAAQRLVRVHSLCAADALQLAAAMIGAEYDPPSLPFVCLDDRLSEAARREGFDVAPR